MPRGISFPRPEWFKPNLLRTGVSLFCSETHKRAMASTAACKWGAKEQTAEHVTAFCPIYYHRNGARAAVVPKRATVYSPGDHKQKPFFVLYKSFGTKRKKLGAVLK